MDIVTLSTYSSFIQKTIQLTNIQPNDRIIDLGVGTGRNACIMMNYLSVKGELIALDISNEMTTQFKNKGFNNFEKHLFFLSYLRLLKGVKLS